MNKQTKRILRALAASGLLVGGLVGAQAAQGSSVQPETQLSASFGRKGHGAGMGMRGLPFGRLALGTTVEVNFYDGDPETAGEALDTLQTLTFTYGEDSEAAFTEAFVAARENAAYMTVDTSEQTRTVDLSELEASSNSRGLLPRELAGRGFGAEGLENGGTVTAIFYDGDPEAGAQAKETLSFTYGEDSAAGFADAFSDAAEEASFVNITTSPTSYTVDLSAVPERSAGRFNSGSRGRGHR